MRQVKWLVSLIPSREVSASLPPAPGPGYRSLRDLAVDPQGNPHVMMGGYLQFYDNRPGFGLYRKIGPSEITVVELSQEGKILNPRPIPNLSFPYAYGSLAVGAGRQKAVSLTYAHYAPSDSRGAGAPSFHSIVSAFSASGDSLWRHQPSSGFSGFLTLMIDASGNVFARTSLGEDERTFLSRFTRNRAMAQVLRFPNSPSSTRLDFFGMDAQTNFYVAAPFAKTNRLWGTLLQSRGSDDVVLAKLDRNGDLVWHLTIGSEGRESVDGLCTSSSGLVTVIGRLGRVGKDVSRRNRLGL